MQVLKFAWMIATNEQSELRNSSGNFTILTAIELNFGVPHKLALVLPNLGTQLTAKAD
jgi:hypothetical protein